MFALVKHDVYYSIKLWWWACILKFVVSQFVNISYIYYGIPKLKRGKLQVSEGESFSPFGLDRHWLCY